MMILKIAKTIYLLVALIFAPIGFLTCIVWGIWLADNEIPLKVYHRSVLYTNVKPGENFVYWNLFERSKFCRVIVKRWIEDSRGVVHEVSTLYAGMPTEGLNTLQVGKAVYPVPESGVSGGVAYAAFQTFWYCNPAQEFHNWPIVGPVTKIRFYIDAPIKASETNMQDMGYIIYDRANYFNAGIGSWPHRKPHTLRGIQGFP